MDCEKHYKAFENMYLNAPIKEIFPSEISICKGLAEIKLEIKKEYFHSGGGVHGSVIFKVLDDAAFFAANSLETEFFVLTTSFTTYITRPISSGYIKGTGKVVNKNNTQFIVESVAYDNKSREVVRGNGIFIRGKFRLENSKGYAAEF